MLLVYSLILRTCFLLVEMLALVLIIIASVIFSLWVFPTYSTFGPQTCTEARLISSPLEHPVYTDEIEWLYEALGKDS